MGLLLQHVHCEKKVEDFPVPAGMSLTTWLVVTSRLGTGKSLTFFLQCNTVVPYPGHEMRVDSAGWLALYRQSWKTAPIGQHFHNKKPYLSSSTVEVKKMKMASKEDKEKTGGEYPKYT